MDIGMTVEQLIQHQINIICSKREIVEIQDIIETDTIGEVIEKLCILHIRNWMLEDLASTTIDDKEFVVIKRKIEICYKQKRPKLIEAINRLIDNSIISGKNLFEESLKRYSNEY